LEILSRILLEDVKSVSVITPATLPCLSLELRGGVHIQGRTGSLTSPTYQGAQPPDCSWFWWITLLGGLKHSPDPQKRPRR
jgi:hypothetical protein